MPFSPSAAFRAFDVVVVALIFAALL